MTDNRIAEMTQCLSELASGELAIEDQSHHHIGHEGAKGGGGHFAMKIVSDQFEGLSQLQRHRQVYTALGKLMHKEIHALQIEALTPGEVRRKIENFGQAPTNPSKA